MTKLPEELHHILGEVAHPCSAFCGIGELGSYVVGLINSLACTERAFDLISLPHGPVHRGLPFRAWRFLGRPAKRLRVALDFQVFENIPVRLVHVDLVRMDGGWQVAPTLHVFVNVQLQVNTLIVCIPAVMVDEVVALYDAHAYLCPKLDAGSCLAPDNGAQVWLEDADDTVRALVDSLPEHVILLVVHPDDGSEDFLLVKAEEIIPSVVGSQEVHHQAHVLIKVTQQQGHGVMHHPSPLPCLLDEQQIGMAGILVVKPRAANAESLAYLFHILAQFAATCLNEVDVHRIPYLGIGTGRVHLQLPTVLTPLAVDKGRRVLVLGWSHRRLVITTLGLFLILLTGGLLHLPFTPEKRFRHLVDVILADALAKVYEKCRVEDRLVSELLQTAQILHVGILPDHLYGVNV